jgi:glycerate kinase
MDAQTAFGKTPAGIAGLSNRQGKPVIAFTGSLVDGPDKLPDTGFAAVIPIADKPMTLEQSLSDAGKLLENAGERAARLVKLGGSLVP